jgi:superfamily I DNA/RNA helicase
MQYERWKNKVFYYDMMDIVNYLLVQFKYGRYTGAPVHYLMIDEVQDLSHATLLLLSKITE